MLSAFRHQACLRIAQCDANCLRSHIVASANSTTSCRPPTTAVQLSISLEEDKGIQVVFAGLLQLPGPRRGGVEACQLPHPQPCHEPRHAVARHKYNWPFSEQTVELMS